MELIIVLGMSLIILLVFVTLSSNILSSIGVQKNYNDAYGSVQKLAYAADSVYPQGDGAWTTVTVVIPANANLSPNATYIGKPASAAASMPSTSINMRLGSSDVFTGTKETVIGSFPTSPGTYQMRVASQGSYVTIGAYFFDVSDQSIYKSMAPNEWRAENVSFTATSNEAVNITVALDFSYQNIISPSPSPASLSVTPGGGSNSTALNFSALQAAAGVYSGQLSVTGTSNKSGVVESFVIPITIEVQKSS